MLNVAWPWLALTLPLPVLIAAAVPRAREESGAALRLPFFREVGGWAGARRGRRHGPRVLLAAVAWVCLVGAACRPQLVGEPLGLPVTGRDLMLAVDISGSMKTRDLTLPGVGQVSRLQVVKQIAGDFVQRRHGDRLGLILFGTRAYLQTPLTFDRDTVHTLLGEAAIGLAGERTAIGDAIGLAVKRLHDRPAASRVLVLLTDGSNTAGVLEPLRAAEMAALDGLRVYAIGVGADTAGLSRRLGVFTVNPAADLDEKVLQDIARVTGGRYFRARDTAELASIYARIDELEPASREDEVLRPVLELYPWPTAAAVALVLVLIAMDVLAILRGRPGSRGREALDA